MVHRCVSCDEMSGSFIKRIFLQTLARNRMAVIPLVMAFVRDDGRSGFGLDFGFRDLTLHSRDKQSINDLKPDLYFKKTLMLEFPLNFLFWTDERKQGTKSFHHEHIHLPRHCWRPDPLLAYKVVTTIVSMIHKPSRSLNQIRVGLTTHIQTHA